jgi:hypothetical protein
MGTEGAKSIGESILNLKKLSKIELELEYIYYLMKNKIKIKL